LLGGSKTTIPFNEVAANWRFVEAFVFCPIKKGPLRQ
jgi:hypothetical protein